MSDRKELIIAFIAGMFSGILGIHLEGYLIKVFRFNSIILEIIIIIIGGLFGCLVAMGSSRIFKRDKNIA